MYGKASSFHCNGRLCAREKIIGIVFKALARFIKHMFWASKKKNYEHKNVSKKESRTNKYIVYLRWYNGMLVC